MCLTAEYFTPSVARHASTSFAVFLLRATQRQVSLAPHRSEFVAAACFMRHTESACAMREAVSFFVDTRRTASRTAAIFFCDFLQHDYFRE
jgi:hypothetical protein